ncbi:MAG: hypothetical protein KDA78_16325 [Planctomycetaceae bacterium]|nr:hypothetical protein [Planctomycetaceae bacterium]
MNEEHHHGSADNDLEKAIAKAQLKFREIAEIHGNRIMLWTSAVLLLIAAYVYYTRTNQATSEDSWSAFSSARTPEELAGVADSYTGTPVGELAKIGVAERYLETGIRLMFTDREAGKTELEEAKKAFNEFLNGTITIGITKDRALFGLARTQEALSDGNFEECLKSYNKLLTESPETPYKPIVEERIKYLETASAKDFYAWFSAQNPKPQDIEQPEDLLKKLNLDQNLPPASTSDSSVPPTTSSTAMPPLSVPSAPDFPPAASSSPAGTSSAANAPPMPAGSPAGEPTPPAGSPEAKPPAPAGTSSTAPTGTSSAPSAGSSANGAE